MGSSAMKYGPQKTTKIGPSKTTKKDIGETLGRSIKAQDRRTHKQDTGVGLVCRVYAEHQKTLLCPSVLYCDTPVNIAVLLQGIPYPALTLSRARACVHGPVLY